MSTSIDNLRRIAGRDVRDHTAIFDLYVSVGRNLEYLAIKFGMDPEDLIHLLEGYGEKIQMRPEDVEGRPAEEIDPEIRKNLREFGLALDESGRGRLQGLPRVLVEEYVERFYPGIASEHPENDWINIEAYLDQLHPGWQVTLQRIQDGGDSAGAGGSERCDDAKRTKKRTKSRFRLFG